MALTTFQENITRIASKLLQKDLRYRSLVVQSKSSGKLEVFRNNFRVIAEQLNFEFEEIRYSDFFDEIGAISVTDSMSMIKNRTKDRLVLVEGPLHFIDYWSDISQSNFWGFLATYTRGSGVVLLDFQRNSLFEKDFIAIEKSICGDILFCKSRLSITENKLL